MRKSIDLPLKSAIHVDIIEPFKKYVIAQVGQRDWGNIEPVMIEIQKQRQSLDFVKIGNQIGNDFRLCDEYEQKLTVYIRHIYMLDNIFRSAFSGDKNALKCNFTWTDSLSLDTKGITINSAKYELISALYNLAIIYYIDASALLVNDKEEERLKAVSKLQRGYWCLNEIKQQIPQLLLDPKFLPADLNPTFLTVLCNYFIGLGYSILLNILMTRNTNPVKLASTNKAAAQSFQIAYDILESSSKVPYPESISKNLKASLLYYAVIHRSQAYDNIVKMHLERVDDEILKGHMGLAVSYLRLAQNDLDMLINKKEYFNKLSAIQRDEITRTAQKISKNYMIFKEKNDKVYHQAEFDVHSLPEIPNETKMIQPLEPKEIKSRLDQERLFEGLLSPEAILLRQELINIISLNQVEIENSAKKVLDTKNQIYSQHRINYLIDLSNTQSNQKVTIPEKLQKKLEIFHKNGGYANYQNLKKFNEDASKQGSIMINEIKTKLNEEKEQDSACRSKYPNDWNRPISEFLNHSYFVQLADLEQKYLIAQQMDAKVAKKYDSVLGWMEKLSNSPEVVANMIPKSTDSVFLQQNREGLLELANLNKQIEELLSIEIIRKSFNETVEELMKSDYVQSLTAIVNKKVEKASEFEKLLVPIKNRVDFLNNKFKDGLNIINQASEKAKVLNSLKDSKSEEQSKIIEDITLNINIINELFDDLMQGSNFYNTLSIHLSNLEKIVAGYCTAREYDKNVRLQELATQMNYSTFNKPGQYAQINQKLMPTQPQQQQPTQVIVTNLGGQLKPGVYQGTIVQPTIVQGYYPNIQFGYMNPGNMPPKGKK